ncbi:ABC transporter permease [Nisaea acidiphila]|uniref:ABC transporter permease n=1 Tax=Nisaea acidiphila TaxID=1862145 RepID=A0A9J7AWU4_9PROT|nr:ABC transporter permease [Nisaea acidiphila]UUX49917.1 ABC transporter permease [Nisaea acidiphila]
MMAGIPLTVIGGAIALAFGIAAALTGWDAVSSSYAACSVLLAGAVAASIVWRVGALGTALIFLSVHAAAFPLMWHLGTAPGDMEYGYWGLLIASWLLAWTSVSRLTKTAKSLPSGAKKAVGLLIPLIFGLWLMLIWEAITRGAGVPQVLLPAPSAIWAKLTTSLPILWADFVQTFLKAVIAGYVLGCGIGFGTAILVDRSPFLKRGLVPVGNMVSALPIIGIAPIMVMWFGFDWQSKAAVVVIMTFFPMLVNTLEGLSASSAMQRDLMRTYAASYGQTLWKMRLVEALPFIFNALKINSTLALIGAIVAEFFGTPIVGMGFRISTEVGRMNVDMVWAEIAVAALAGSAFYGALVLIERALTFWHPSNR